MIPRLGKYPGEGNGNPAPVFLPGKSYGQRSLAGSSACSLKSWTQLSDQDQVVWFACFFFFGAQNVGLVQNSNIKQYNILYERTNEESYKNISIDEESPLQINILL